ncbi:reverse transcriptase domain-containing protein [Tanacetum coccineum]
MPEGEIDNLTMEQYLALTRGNQASSVVKPEIGGNVNFEIKSQFMWELKEDTFFGNKNDNAHEYVEQVLDIVSLFNILRVSHDAVMLRVLPITLTGAAKRNLGTNINVIPKSIFEHLKLARLKKTNMLVEMADMTKRSPIGIVENILVKIDKFLFPSDFVVINMLNKLNETMILGRPFLATIHAEIDVFNKEISLGIRSDRVTFNMDKKIHNFTTSIREIYMINATSNTPSDASSRVEKTNDVHNKNNFCNQEQG